MEEQFESIIIYMLVFLTSIILFWIGQKLYEHGSRAVILGKIILFLAVLVPSILAGMRANSVGIDVDVYIAPNMRRACSNSVNSFVDCCLALDMAPEYFYMFLVYISSLFTADEWLLLFLLQFFTIGPIALAAIKLRKEISVPLAMGTYLFCFYNNTLNVMRQSVAVAFIFLGAVYIFKNSMKLNTQAVVCLITACFFHKTGIIGVLAIYTLCKISTIKLERWIYIMIYACIILIPVIITPIYEFFESQNLVNDVYSVYANIFLYSGIKKNWFVKSPFTLGNTAMVLCWLFRISIPCFLLRQNNIKEKVIYHISLCGAAIYLIVFYTMNTIYGLRLSTFFDIFIVLLVPYAAQKPNKKMKMLILWLMIVMFWLLCVILLKQSGETNIYKFRI